MKIKAGLLIALFVGLSTIVSANGKILSGATSEAESDAARTSNQTSGIRGVDFLNYSYQTSVCSEEVGLPKTVKVRGGKYKDRDQLFFDVDRNEIAYGDVNGDGSEDAVVPIRCGSGAGTLRAFEVHAYSLQNGQAKLLARLDSTTVESDYKQSYPDGIIFYAGETGPKIVNGHIIVEALADGSFAGPENIATFDYQLSGGKFVLRGKPTQSKKVYDSLVTDGTFKGTLHAGKAESFMVYVGEESGDFAAFCFANDSEAGRAILAACKDGDTCEFTGTVDQGVECQVDKETQKTLSASGRILSVKSARSLSTPSSGKPGKTPAVSNRATVQEKRDIFQLITRQDKEISEFLRDSPADADRLAQSVTVRKIDLNADGQPEYVAVMEDGVICGALANCPHWVYRRAGGGYELLGHTRARTVIMEKSSTHGYRDLRAWGGSTATEDGFDILKYDGGKYRATDCFSRDNSGKVPKVTRIRCTEVDEGAQ